MFIENNRKLIGDLIISDKNSFVVTYLPTFIIHHKF